ncbi:MAG TPA: glycosyltransferase family 9 protein [Vicinamibacterales bacterium]|jgi:lipopolysaccharide heptosyltransferase I
MNILIVRLGSLGDVIHAIPAAAALRRAFATARIDWLVDAPHRDIVELVTTLDRVVVLRGGTLPAWASARRELRAARYDVALDFQGLLKSAVLARASGAARVVGFTRRDLREKTARFFYTASANGEGAHAILKNLRLLQTLGIEDDGIEFPLRPVESAALSALRSTLGGSRVALINPGAAWPNKRWPAGRFGQLAASIRERHALVPVVLWGPGEEELAAAVVAASGGAAVLAPPTSVRDLVAFCRAADLFVAGDTGPLHVATAVGTPTVSLYGPTDPARNGPWSSSDVFVSRADRCGCPIERSCRQARWCLEEITVADVDAAVQRRLAVGETRG